jgi:uncharacterized protein YcfJ
MNAKKILCLLSAGTILTAAAPAFADPHRWEPRHDRGHAQKRVVVVERHYRAPVRHVIVERPVYVQRRPVVVMHQHPVYYGPEPVYAGYGGYDGNTALSTLGGAVIGAAVGSQIGRGSGNTAAIAIGAVVGGILGSGR